ncbi:MAG: Dabb family protein [Balneolales bacterium]
MKIFLKIFITGILLVIMTACQSGNQSDFDASKNAAGLIQHNVYFYLNEGVTSEETAQFEAGLLALMEIEDIYKSEIGIPASTESRDVTDHKFVYSIFSWFKSLEDQKSYQDHPVHLDFIDKYSHLWANVRVYDSEIISSQ